MIRKERTRLFLIISILLMTGKSVNILANNRFVTNTYPIPYQHLVLASPIKGDVNNDKKVDISDVVAVINTIAGNPTFRATADVNGDNKVDISDIVAIINIIANGVQVESDPAVEKGLCPDVNHPHIIDMGEAGKWACCNVGAEAPWEFGGHYSWGETIEKSYYGWITYSHCDDGRSDTRHYLGDDISGTEYDVAHVLWKDDWHTPNVQQMKLLLENCTQQIIVFNDAYGIKFTSPEGASIFLPAAGMGQYSDLAWVGVNGDYWTSTQDPDEGIFAMGMSFSTIVKCQGYDRSFGRSVRPVTGPAPEVVNVDPAVEAGLCPDEHHPHIINLGPAGLWSCCNVGATAPWEYGGYYAWGETFQKDYYDVKGYVNQESFLSLGDNIAGTENDVAHVIMGDGWQMPSYYNHIQNLSNHCSREWITLNGVPGRQYIASNGNSIFLPAAGYWSGYEKKELNEEGLYMSADRNKNYGCLTISNFSAGDILSADDFGKGMSVRAVAVPPSLTDPAVEAGLCPDAHHPHVIDMGSAGKWACCNVGGSYPWEVGNFYAWGETEPKQYYETENYIHCDGSSETYHDIGADIAGTDYDVAHVKWGSSWRMPTGEQIQALTNKCSEKWTQIYGVEGMIYTSPEGGSIFFPAAGYRIWGLIYQPKECNYWSSTLCEWGNEYSNTLECSEEEAGDVSTMTREWGILVRPVWK